MLFIIIGINNPVLANAQSDKNILIIIPSATEPYTRIVKSIKEELVNTHWTKDVAVLNLQAIAYAKSEILKGHHLIIPVGAKAVDYYLRQNIRTPFITSFITESAFSTLIRKAKQKGRHTQHFIGGVSLEQPSHRLASLVRLLGASIESVGVILGPNTRKKRAEIQKEINRIGSMLHVADIKSYDNPLKKLRQVFQKSQAVIVVPDKAKFNRNLARWVVTLSYKYKVPVIPYSKKYADAGALISLFSQGKEIGKQTAEMALTYIKKHRAPRRLLPPKYFQIYINRSVNKALGFKLPPSEVLVRKLQITKR